MDPTLKAQTYLPQSAKELEVVSNFLAAFQVRKGKSFPQRYLLVGTKAGEEIQLPAEFYQVLVQVVKVMKKGMAVTVAPQTAMLTTQEAANIIGISRPTLISLLEKGLIEFELVGRHRRISIDKVLKYRAARKELQYRALDDMYDASEEVSPSDYLGILQKARKPVTGAIQKSK